MVVRQKRRYAVVYSASNLRILRQRGATLSSVTVRDCFRTYIARSQPLQPFTIVNNTIDTNWRFTDIKPRAMRPSHMQCTLSETRDCWRRNRLEIETMITTNRECLYIVSLCTVYMVTVYWAHF